MSRTNNQPRITRITRKRLLVKRAKKIQKDPCLIREIRGKFLEMHHRKARVPGVRKKRSPVAKPDFTKGFEEAIATVSIAVLPRKALTPQEAVL